MASLRGNSFVDASRGVGVAVALGALVLGVFLVIAYGRYWHFPVAPKPVTKSMPPQRPEGSSPKAGKDDGDTAPPGAPGSAGFAVARSSQATSNAGAALRQVLHDYKADPRKTMNATISSTGQVRIAKDDALTTFDGLPERAINTGSMLSGSVAGAGPSTTR
jgi:hypothetical protein